MARIEWAALGGDEVETVISMLMFNEHPRATRIRPSRGDFGIDVLVPSAGDASFVDVHQIKKFALNLDASQKRQIEDSFQRILLGLVRRDIPLADWHLVMPLDPTIENAFDWFAGMPDVVIARMSADVDLALTEEELAAIRAWQDAPDRLIEWKGLTYCETLASKYWFVADYYLHGGSERIKSAVSEVTKILHRDLQPSISTAPSTSILEPSDIRDHLQRLGSVLDGDPHFRYGFSVDPFTTPLHDEPELVAATQTTIANGMCVTFRIYARFDEALNERPIPINLRFQFEPGSAEHQAFDDWRKYGKPLTAEVAMDADLPGGLGGSFPKATASILPVDGGNRFESRYRIVDPDGAVLAELGFELASMTGLDGTGVWIEGRDASGVISIEGAADNNDQSGTLKFSSEDPSGSEAVAAASAMVFLENFVSPNKLQVAAKFGPFMPFQDVLEGGSVPHLFVRRYVAALAALQEHMSTPIFVPDLATVTGREAQTVLRAESLLKGQTIVATWESFEFLADGPLAIEEDEYYQIAAIEPLSATVGKTEITFGAVQHTLMSAKLRSIGDGRVRAEPGRDNAAHQDLAPDEPIPPADQKPIRSRRIDGPGVVPPSA